MLKNQPWLRLAGDIMTEYEQCLMEGKDVSSYKPLCEAIAHGITDDDRRDIEDAIEVICDAMRAHPVRTDYPYVEPSDYESIIAASPSAKSAPVLPTVPENLQEHIKGAWYGRIAGCLLGKPVEGWRSELMWPVLKESNNYPLNRYFFRRDIPEHFFSEKKVWKGACFADNIDNCMPIDDDTNYTTFAMKLVERYGRDFKPMDVMEAWMTWIPMFATCTAERAAYRNAALGLLPPETASYKNPYREWIGAQIRGDFFGYCNPGDPAAAASMAFRDASISHVKNGIYGEMFISAMNAAAACTNDIKKIIETGLAYVPEKSRLRADVDEIIAMYDAGKTVDDAIAHIHSRYDEHSSNGWCYTNSNAMIVTMGLLWGNGDFGKSICIAVQACFDTDCNGATVGSIVGMMNAGIPEEWIAPFGGNLRTSIDGYNHVTVDFLAEHTMTLLGK